MRPHGVHVVWVLVAVSREGEADTCTVCAMALRQSGLFFLTKEEHQV